MSDSVWRTDPAFASAGKRDLVRIPHRLGAQRAPQAAPITKQLRSLAVDWRAPN